MQTQEIREARICNTNMKQEGEYIMVVLELDYGTPKKTFGGFVIDDDLTRPYGNQVGMKMLLDVIGVSQWENVCSHTVRIKLVEGTITALGHRDFDIWFKFMP